MFGRKRDDQDPYESRFWHPNRNSRKLIVILSAFLDVVLIAFLAFMLYNYNQEIKQRAAEDEVLTKARLEQEKTDEELIDERAEKVSAVLAEYLPGIVCWGDSLTYGVGTEEENGAYPTILSSMISNDILSKYDLASLSTAVSLKPYTLSCPVINRGGTFEDTCTILGRNGAEPFTIAEDFTIPADTTPTEIKLADCKNQTPIMQLVMESSGLGYVEIDGIKGLLTVDYDTDSKTEEQTYVEYYRSITYTYYFTRVTEGEAVEVEAGTEVLTAGSEQYLNYIPVVFIGEFGGYEDVSELVKQQKEIIEHQSGNPVNEDGTARYIVIGLHTGTAEERADMEAAMQAEFGDHYINLREYMSTDGLTDAGITATEEDAAMMAKGMTPASLLYEDGIHFNSIGYQLLGKLVYERMDELGYFDEVKDAINEAMQPLE